MLIKIDPIQKIITDRKSIRSVVYTKEYFRPGYRDYLFPDTSSSNSIRPAEVKRANEN